jgi:hypothetical protein
MTKKTTIRPIVLLLLSVFTGQVDRMFNSPRAINPFPYYNQPTSLGWYTDYLGDLCSFSILMYCVISILSPLAMYFKWKNDFTHHSLFIFSMLWIRLFQVVFITSLLDIVHFVLAARQWELFFLIQNGIYLLMTGYLIYKAYRK